MSNDDPFTLDLFGNTSLSSGLGLGVTAFGSDFGAEDPVDERPSPPAAPVPHAKPVPQRRRTRASQYSHGSRPELLSRRRSRPGKGLEAARPRQSRRYSARRRNRGRGPAGDARGTGPARSASPASGPRTSPMPCSGVRAKPLSGTAGTRSAPSSRTRCRRQDYASLARCTQYAHFTPEFIVRAMWSGLQRLGWRGGRVLEPGIGTGLFPALMPAELRDRVHVTGVEIDPVTARIARLLAAAGAHRQCRLRARRSAGQFRPRHRQPALFRSHRALGSVPIASMGPRLHDYFIARSIDLSEAGRPRGLRDERGHDGQGGLFGTRAYREVRRSRRRNPPARGQLPGRCRHRCRGRHPVLPQAQAGRGRGRRYLARHSTRSARADGDEGAIRVNRWFARHPDFVLGTHAITSGPFGETYTCLPRPGVDLATALSAAIPCFRKPSMTASPRQIDLDVTTTRRSTVGGASERSRDPRGQLLHRVERRR